MSFHCSHSTGNSGNILRTESNSSCSISCIYIGNWRHCNEDFEYGLHCPILHIVQLLLEEPKASYHGRQRAQKLACLNIHNLAKKILRALYYDFMNDLTKKILSLAIIYECAVKIREHLIFEDGSLWLQKDCLLHGNREEKMTQIPTWHNTLLWTFEPMCHRKFMSFLKFCSNTYKESELVVGLVPNHMVLEVGRIITEKFHFQHVTLRGQQWRTQEHTLNKMAWLYLANVIVLAQLISFILTKYILSLNVFIRNAKHCIADCYVRRVRIDNGVNSMWDLVDEVFISWLIYNLRIESIVIEVLITNETTVLQT